MLATTGLKQHRLWFDEEGNPIHHGKRIDMQEHPPSSRIQDMKLPQQAIGHNATIYLYTHCLRCSTITENPKTKLSGVWWYKSSPKLRSITTPKMNFVQETWTANTVNILTDNWSTSWTTTIEQKTAACLYDVIIDCMQVPTSEQWLSITHFFITFQDIFRLN